MKCSEGTVKETNDPGVVLSEAVSLMQQGRYAESLQKHLWFHDHALEHNSALAGVRLSFALADWIELAKRYPEAMVALLAVRDRKAKALADGQGSFELFHDVAAINGFLQEEQGIIALFKLLHQTDPKLAKKCYRVAETVLVAHQEYEVCSAYIPDPTARFEEIRELRQVKLELADKNPTLDRPEFREYAEVSFAQEIQRLIAILVGTNRRQEAERVRELGLAVSESAIVRKALADTVPPEDHSS
jgi:hypothetical protein